MTVSVLKQSWEYGDGEANVVGVYAERELAEAVAARFKKEYPDMVYDVEPFVVVNASLLPRMIKAATALLRGGGE